MRHILIKVTRSIFNNLQKKYADRVRFYSFEETHPQDKIDIIIAPSFVLNKFNFSAYPSLKWVQLTSAGYDGLDLAYLKRHQIILTNAKGVYASAIAEDVLAKVLWFNRELSHYHKLQKEKQWEQKPYLFELEKSTVVIIGAGDIGQEIAKRFKPFKVKLYGYRREKIKTPPFKTIINTLEQLKSLLTKADYVIGVLPSSTSTYKFFDQEKLSWLKKTAVFINVGRGDTVDQNCLIEVLKARKIRGAALDVMEEEPLPINNELWGLDNVFITPHNSGLTPLMTPKLKKMISKNLKNYLNQDPLLNIIKL